MQKCKLKCNRNCNNLMMQIRLAKKMQRWDRQSSRSKKMQLGQGIAKKNTKQPPNCKKKSDVTDKVQKKRCDRQSVKKRRDGTGKVQKKMQCDRHIAKKKRWNGQSAKKNATGQLVVSRIWERQPTG